MNSSSMGSMKDDKALSYDFQIGAVLNEAWEKTKGMKAPAWGAFLIVFLIGAAFGILETVVSYFLPDSSAKLVQGLLQVIQIIIITPLGVGIAYLGVRRAVNWVVQSKQIFGMYHYFWRIVGMAILQAVVIWIFAFILALSFIFSSAFDMSSFVTVILIHILQVVMILITLFVLLSFTFAYLLIVEKNLGVFKAYTASFFAFKQHWIKIITVYFIMLILLLVSLIPLLLGMIWTYPMAINLKGILYRIAFGVSNQSL